MSEVLLQVVSFFSSILLTFIGVYLLTSDREAEEASHPGALSLSLALSHTNTLLSKSPSASLSLSRSVSLSLSAPPTISSLLEAVREETVPGPLSAVVSVSVMLPLGPLSVTVTVTVAD